MGEKKSQHARARDMLKLAVRHGEIAALEIVERDEESPWHSFTVTFLDGRTERYSNAVALGVAWGMIEARKVALARFLRVGHVHEIVENGYAVVYLDPDASLLMPEPFANVYVNVAEPS